MLICPDRRTTRGGFAQHPFPPFRCRGLRLGLNVCQLPIAVEPRGLQDIRGRNGSPNDDLGEPPVLQLVRVRVASARPPFQAVDHIQALLLVGEA